MRLKKIEIYINNNNEFIFSTVVIYTYRIEYTRINSKLNRQYDRFI